MKRHFFSVIIPTRQIDESIRNEVLPALARQTHRSFEVIILPNSVDPSDNKLLKLYPWLSIIATNSKKMPGDKRDIGAQHAKGNILTFLDDDAVPISEWLENADRIFESKPYVVSLGGPGILPPNATMIEKIFDMVMNSWLGSGGYSYRFTKKAERYVDDFPSMNLLMKTEVFKRLGGFNNQYWPGEDSKLLNNLILKEKKMVFYHPDVVVYHHRRSNLAGHLKQHRNYGYHRGTFYAHGDTNSKSLTYLVPAFFTLYIFVFAMFLVLASVREINAMLLAVMSIPLILYIYLLISESFYILLNTKNILISLATSVTIALTHLTYGLFFIYGYLKALIYTYLSLGTRYKAQSHPIG